MTFHTFTCVNVCNIYMDFTTQQSTCTCTYVTSPISRYDSLFMSGRHLKSLSSLSSPRYFLNNKHCNVFFGCEIPVYTCILSFHDPRNTYTCKYICIHVFLDPTKYMNKYSTTQQNTCTCTPQSTCISCCTVTLGWKRRIPCDLRS